MRPRFLIPMVILLGSLAGCGQGQEPPAAVYLPEGDAQRGRVAFLELQCNACHTVSGVEMPAPVAEPPVGVMLGGETVRVPTKGELCTAIVHPSHDLAVGVAVARTEAGGVSRMGDYCETLTVQQLVDLVAFLRARYEVTEHIPLY